MTPQDPTGRGDSERQLKEPDRRQRKRDEKRPRTAIDPLIDCVFKKIFGSEEHKRLLIHFLNSLLGPRAGIDVTEVELLNPYNQRDLLDDKLTEVDVKACDNEGRVYQIEVQLVLGGHITRRMVYTWSSVMAKQIEKGNEFYEVQPVIGIWLFKRDLFKGGSPACFFQWYDRDEGTLLTAEDYLIAIELDKWAGLLNRGDRGKMGVCQSDGGDENKDEDGNNGKDGLSGIERWVWILTHGKEIDLDDPPVECRTPEMLEVVEVLKSFTQEDREWDLYERRMIAQSERATWKGYTEAARKELKKVQKEMRETRAELRKEAREKERYRKAAEQAEQTAEEERLEREKAIQTAEKESTKRDKLIRAAEEERKKAIQTAEIERLEREKATKTAEKERLEREEKISKAVIALSNQRLGPEDIAASLGLELEKVRAVLESSRDK